MYVHASLPYPSAFSSPSSSSAPWVQVVVRNAGHMTPAFAPRASYEMFERFLRGSRKGIIFLSTNSRILFVVPSQLVFQSAHAVSISTESTPSGHAPRPNARLDTTSSPVMFASTPPPPLSCSPRHHLLPCHARLGTTSSPVLRFVLRQKGQRPRRAPSLRPVRRCRTLRGQGVAAMQQKIDLIDLQHLPRYVFRRVECFDRFSFCRLLGSRENGCVSNGSLLRINIVQGSIMNVVRVSSVAYLLHCII